MRTFFWSFFEVVETIVIAIGAVLIVRTFIAQPFLVSGSSMEPSFHDGNYLLVDELTYRLRDPQRGEVIVFRYPGDPTSKSYYIKRVIGLPHEKLVIDSKGVTISSQGEEKHVSEPYILQFDSSTFGRFEIELGDNQYFVMGDNRNFSFDSRSWGPLRRSDIIGIARFRLWPVDQIDAFVAPLY